MTSSLPVFCFPVLLSKSVIFCAEIQKIDFWSYLLHYCVNAAKFIVCECLAVLFSVVADR